MQTLEVIEEGLFGLRNHLWYTDADLSQSRARDGNEHGIARTFASRKITQTSTNDLHPRQLGVGRAKRRMFELVRRALSFATGYHGARLFGGECATTAYSTPSADLRQIAAYWIAHSFIISRL